MKRKFSVMGATLIVTLIVTTVAVWANSASADFGEATQRARATLNLINEGARATTTPYSSGVDGSTRVKLDKGSWVWGGSVATTSDVLALPIVSAESYHYCGTYSHYLKVYI